MKLDYAANKFAALDRFGRVVDQIWYDYGTSDEIDWGSKGGGVKGALICPIIKTAGCH